MIVRNLKNCNLKIVKMIFFFSSLNRESRKVIEIETKIKTKIKKRKKKMFSLNQLNCTCKAGH